MSKVKEIEIPILFHNYKLLEEKEFVLQGSNVYFVQGPNEVGKTSFLTALQGAMTAKDITPKKVSINDKGEDSGFYEFTIPAADGSMVTIRNEFTDDKNKFIAVQEDGKKVSAVGEIRKLFNYTPINVNEFFAMSRSADGRRKQRDIILKLLPEEAREQFVEFDLQEQHYFTKRTETGRQMDTAKGYIASVTISEEDTKLLEREEEANKLMETYEGYINGRLANSTILSTIEALKSEKQRLLDRIADIDKTLEANEAKLGNTEPDDIKKLSDEDIQLKVSQGKEVIRRITEIRARQTLKQESQEKFDKLEKAHAEETKNIESLREKKKAIIANADLPIESISFEDEYLIIDGFKFDETQVCESDAVLLLANILAKINPGPIQVIGDASILDAKKLEKLNRIAETNNKVMFVDEVVRTSNEIVVVGYEKVVEGGPVPKKPSKTPEIDKIDPVIPKKDESKDEENTDNKPLF